MVKATTAGKQRAVSGIEQAIAETHARLAACGSAKELQQKAQAALESTTKETHDELIARITKQLQDHARRGEIAASEGSAERWAHRVKLAKAALRGIEAKEYTWGAGFRGTKAALIKAGLLDAKTRISKGGQKKYQLPLNHHEGYKAACFFGPIPPSWDATVNYDGYHPNIYWVAVHYNIADMEVRERTKRAFEELDRPDMNMALLRRLISEIPPVPLSVQVPEEIKASKKYGKDSK